MRNKKKLTHIWPHYINSSLKLSEGRKLSIQNSVSKPSLSEIEKALTKLDIEYETFPRHKYPGNWYEKSGEIVADYQGNKLELLKNISHEIKAKRN